MDEVPLAALPSQPNEGGTSKNANCMKTTSALMKRGSGSRTPDQDQIAAAAYNLYLQNGCQPGHELDDWLRAEKLLIQADGNGGSRSRPGNELQAK
jgi:hypothetical protein